jgi:PAS domain S-box-containing protein
MSCDPSETLESLRAERDALRRRLAENDDVFAAIRSGKADIVLKDEVRGHHIATFDEASETYRLIIESIEQGAATLSTVGTVLYANRSLAAMFGVPLGKLIGSSLFHHIPRDYHAMLAGWLSGQSGEKKSGEWRLPCVATGKTLLHAVISPLPARSGSSYSLVVTDIGPVLEREELRRNKVNLEREAVELTAAKQAAEQGSRAKSIFLATMSHELRTPMNAIIGFTELLLMTEKDPNRCEQMNIIREASGSLLQIIHDILDLSRIEAGQTTVHDEDFILSEVIGAVGAMFSAQASRKMIDFTIHIDPRLPTRVRSDPGLLKQVLVNLVGNAIKFTSSGSVELRLDDHGFGSIGDVVTVVFHITDTGIGIKPENLDRIFEMFEQEDSSFTRRFGGSGLGLSISKRLVSLLGGEIWVESMPGIGSRFSFTATFPIIRATHTEAPAAVATIPANLRPTARILVVDDDPFSRKLLVNALEGSGYLVIPAGDGDKALEALERQAFDVILLDIQLPRVSGLEVVRKIRSGRLRKCPPALPVIAITAYAMTGDRERFLDEGMTDYLSKPINVAHMLTTVAGYCPAVPVGVVAPTLLPQETEERNRPDGGWPERVGASY